MCWQQASQVCRGFCLLQICCGEPLCHQLSPPHPPSCTSTASLSWSGKPAPAAHGSMLSACMLMLLQAQALNLPGWESCPSPSKTENLSPGARGLQEQRPVLVAVAFIELVIRGGGGNAVRCAAQPEQAAGAPVSVQLQHMWRRSLRAGPAKLGPLTSRHYDHCCSKILCSPCIQ